MGFYIIFNNFSSLLESSQSADLAEDIETAVADSVVAAGSDASEIGQVTVLVETDGKILLKVDDSSDGAASAIDYEKSAAALLSQIPAASAPKAEQMPLSKMETEVLSQNEDNDKFYPMFEELKISLRYRIDYVDILKGQQAIEISESIDKLAEKNRKKERAGQDQQAERRFQEKQAENIKECLKQKRFISHLQK